MGWTKQSKRHSNARKYGRAGGQYAKPKKRFKTPAKPNTVSNIKTYSGDYFTKKQVKEIETKVGSKFTNTTYEEARGTIYEFEDDSEWIIYENYDEAERQTIEYVEEQLEEEPELFNQEWINEFIEVREEDMSFIADDLTETDMDRDEDELKEEAERRGIDIKDDNWEEDLRDSIYDDHLSELERDSKGYLVDDLGLYTEEDFSKQNFVVIDTEQASINAVNTDGVAHFLAEYDGEEVVTKSGVYMYRTN